MYNDLIKLRPKVKTWKGEPFTHAEEKADGYRVGVCVTEDDIQFYGRKPKELFVPGHIHKIFRNVPPDSIIDMELFVPGHGATEVPRAIKNESKALDVMVFGIYRWGGSTPSEEEHAYLLTKFPRPTTIPEEMFDWERSLLTAEEQGDEGWVLKGGVLGPWYKLKVVKTIDCVVSKCHMGEGQSFMRIASLELAVYREGKLVDIGVAKLQDDDDRLPYKKEFIQKYIGRVVEVDYDCVAAKGRLKFARFIRWRDDKPANECVDISN